MGKGQKTQVVGLRGGCSFPFPPSLWILSKGLDVAVLRLVSFLLVAGLSFSEKIQTWDKRNTREKDVISTGCIKHPKVPFLLSPNTSMSHPEYSRLIRIMALQLSPRLTVPQANSPRAKFYPQPTKWQHLPLNEPQNGGCPLGRSLYIRGHRPTL